jgi:hypothetical protein
MIHGLLFGPDSIAHVDAYRSTVASRIGVVKLQLNRRFSTAGKFVGSLPVRQRNGIGKGSTAYRVYP